MPDPIPERPLVEAGMWIDGDCDGTDDDCPLRYKHSHVGCLVCGWEKIGEHEEMIGEWYAHSHDPLCDIRWRASVERTSLQRSSPDLAVLELDVRYLLWLRDYPDGDIDWEDFYA